MLEGPDHPPLPLEYEARGTPSVRDVRRTTAVSLAMVASLYGVMGLLYLMYIKRGVPLPAEGTWKLYTFGVGAGIGVCSLAALRFPTIAALAALAFFFAVNAFSIIQDPGSIVHGAIVKVLAFIILLRATVQSVEARSRSDR